MSQHIVLIFEKLDHLARMRSYLIYFISQAAALLSISKWQALRPDRCNTLAAFSICFSKYQEHMGKTMKAVAIEPKNPAEPFTAVLLCLQKPGCFSSVERCKALRELSSAENYKYEDNLAMLHEFFKQIIQAAPQPLT